MGEWPSPKMKRQSATQIWPGAQRGEGWKGLGKVVKPLLPNHFRPEKITRKIKRKLRKCIRALHLYVGEGEMGEGPSPKKKDKA